MAVPKIERLLDLLAALLHTERPLTAEQLQERIPGYPPDKDSFKRAFERDKKDLREEGVPLRIETVPGSNPPQEGYRIDPDEYYLRDPGLDADELAAIHLAASAVRLEGSSATAGLRKLGAPLRPDTASSIATLPSAPPDLLLPTAPSTSSAPSAKQSAHTSSAPIFCLLPPTSYLLPSTSYLLTFFYLLPSPCTMLAPFRSVDPARQRRA